jgi:hypothetical protein
MQHSDFTLYFMRVGKLGSHTEGETEANDIWAQRIDSIWTYEQ